MIQLLLLLTKVVVRRGAASVNLDINHIDVKEFLQIRRPKGDPNRQCLNLHQAVVVDDAFMKRSTR